MQLTVDGNLVFAATGGRPHADGKPIAVFLHGAGMDHTVWAQQTRWLAFHGWNVLAVDLPGHGESAGAPLRTIEALADWLLALLIGLHAVDAVLIGHSMGSLVALQAAANAPDQIAKLVLIGSAATMPVHADLLAAAEADEPAAIDMINLWGHGFRAGLGFSAAPGIWMVGLGRRILEKARPGVLFADLRACNAYAGGMAAAARIAAPTLLLCGEMDQMTPLKNGRALAAAIAGSTLEVVGGAGHMLLAERPATLATMLARHLNVSA